jgi:hypothetical protein
LVIVFASRECGKTTESERLLFRVVLGFAYIAELFNSVCSASGEQERHTTINRDGSRIRRVEWRRIITDPYQHNAKQEKDGQ